MNTAACIRKSLKAYATNKMTIHITKVQLICYTFFGFSRQRYTLFPNYRLTDSKKLNQNNIFPGKIQELIPYTEVFGYSDLLDGTLED